MTYRERYQKAFNELSAEMDKRDHFMFELKKFYIRTGIVPPKYKDQFEIYKKEKFTSWRKQRKVMRRIKKAARIVASNNKEWTE